VSDCEELVGGFTWT